MNRLTFAVLCCIIVMQLCGCRRSSIDFGSSDSKSLSRFVVLHRTSAKEVVVTDNQEMGIVPGNVQRISMTGPAANLIVVEYLPFDQKPPPAANEFMLVDLSSGKTQMITSQQATTGTKFEDIASILPP